MSVAEVGSEVLNGNGESSTGGEVGSEVVRSRFVLRVSPAVSSEDDLLKQDTYNGAGNREVEASGNPGSRDDDREGGGLVHEARDLDRT